MGLGYRAQTSHWEKEALREQVRLKVLIASQNWNINLREEGNNMVGEVKGEEVDYM